ncbi:PREDICTED: protein phosphatase 1 regulatory subunit 15B-like [Nanorana parkeri]|uniref:protein phosphatase 1 regulatory subunit 15B-like n=1 Tax=Nanorana parkeri TaxID=125878 RepID=UPI000854A142|nr:PREDICTED: protein phosphatase 1 regulatory subunit 15B-like [Nanorana parkeri]
MSLSYLCFGSYWRNLTSPMTHWHRGTAVQVDLMKVHPEMQVIAGELGTDIVMLTMAARITQSIFTVARNLLHRRPLSWKSKAFQAVLWMCWNIIDFFLAVELRNVFVYKNVPKHSTPYHTEQSMNTISIKCCWGCETELSKQNMVPEKELPSPRMEDLQDNAYMEEVFDHKVFPDMDIMVSKETLLPSCTNPFILSMICVPSEDGESSLPSEESDLSEFESDGESDDHSPPCEESSLSESECGDEEPEHDSSHEDTSVDSGMQELWTLKSKEDMDNSEESDWSEEEDDSWDAESDSDYSRDDDLWDSFCRTDDPYNPLSFAMPTRSPNQQVKKEVLATSSEQPQINVKCCPYIAEDGECETLHCTMQSQAKKPQNCASQKDEPQFLEELKQTGNPGVKKVRFSSNVTVHRMVTWSYHYRMARKGPWEEYARDRSRFQKRIAETEAAISFCLEPGHREKIWAACRCKENYTNVTVHHMVTWSYHYRMARKGPWEEYARDRSRFQKRIAETEAAISFCLEPGHREKIWAACRCKEN